MTMSIVGSGDLSMLGNILSTGSSSQSNTSATSSGSEASFSSSMTISQIRDEVDKMATSGQLTTKQQMALIAAGFQDLNASDPSYQPAGQEGYTRATTGTLDVTSTLESISDFDSAQKNSTLAATYSGLADLFESESPSSVSLTV